MASSMLTGDRRWASARKSGMTILGKVPKPINLPSQRSENHGLDPNVEIVPKGTLTWGSRPSSATTNAWGTSSVSSPLTDGSAGSPSFASGRPSSGGSGTRPSTAGSDKSHEPVSNAWGPNSRPSSASGILVSSQRSAAATRPQSAETRPTSSQLSRFAESSVDNTVAWGTTGTAERPGGVLSKTSGFTLNSGDFPTLGSEKNSDSQSQRGHSSQGRPASSSGTASTPKETLEPYLTVSRNIDPQDCRNVNTWKAENHPYVGDGAPPYVENWHKDPQQAQSYTNVNIPPRQFDSWPNPPYHPADGAWYTRGAPVGPFRAPGPPGNYFDYPHYSSRPLPTAHTFPRPEGSSVGYRPNNGEQYHPHMPPEPYMGPGRPNIPLRPGSYPGTLPYERCHGPPQTGFYNPSEKGPIISMTRPVVYNQFPTQNPNLDPEKYHARPGGHAAAMDKEHMKSNQVHENQGQFRVLLKPHDGWEDCEAQGKGELSVMATAPHVERGGQPGLLRQEGDWRTKNQKPVPAVPVSLSPGEQAPILQTGGPDGRSSEIYGGKSSIKASGDGLIRREETTNARVHDRLHDHVIQKNSTLMEKREGLNTKARVTDGKNDFEMHLSNEGTKSKDMTFTADQSTSMVNVPTSCEAILVPSKLNAIAEEKNRESTNDEKGLHSPPVGICENAPFKGQKGTCGVKAVDHHVKSRSSRHDNAEWMKRVPGSDSSITTGVSGKGGHETSDLDCATSLEASEDHGVPHSPKSRDGSYSAFSLDNIDHKVQRTKMKEIALQRAKQLQQQEEERTREQKAKALAKLEELNRRTLAESLNQKFSHSPTPTNDVVNKNEDSGFGVAPKADTAFSEAPIDAIACDSEAMTPGHDDGFRNTGNLITGSSVVAAEPSNSVIQTSDLSQNQMLAPSQENVFKKVILGTAYDIIDTPSKHKQSGYRRRQSIPQDKSLGEKQTAAMNTGSSTYTGDVAIGTMTNDALTSLEDDSAHHRKRNYKGAKNNRNNLDEGLPNSTFPSVDIEGGKSKPSESAAEVVSIHSESLTETVVPAEALSVQHLSLDHELTVSTEESHARISNRWKPHPHRKSARSQQGNKPISRYSGGTEAVVWAPVKAPIKNEPSVEVNKSSVVETTDPSGMSGRDMPSGMKAKRAERERYVPKPVAKELSQQVNSQQNSPSCGDTMEKPDSVMPTVESGRIEGFAVGKAAIAPDTMNEESIKHNKHGKRSTSWRQRSSDKSPPIEGSSSPDFAKSTQKVSDQLQASAVYTALKGELKHANDGWNDIADSLPPNASLASTAVLKNVGENRQRRQPYNVQRIPRNTYPANNTDADRGVTDRSEIQSRNDSDDGKIMKNESQNVIGEHTKPHWQPKSQSRSHYSRQGSRTSGAAQRVAAQGTDNNTVQNEHEKTVSPRTVPDEARDARHQENKRGSKVVADPTKEDTTVESTPADVNPHQQQSVALGVNQPGNYNNRFQRARDAGYRGKDLGQDAGKQNYKQNNSTHLEYQQVRNYHSKPDDSYQQNPVFGGEAREGSRAPGSRYRERGRRHPRDAAHFYGQSGGVPRVSDS